MARDHIVVDDDSVRESLPLLKHINDYLSGALNLINSSRNNLSPSYKYKVSGYSEVKQRLNDALNENKRLIKKCEEFLETYESTVVGIEKQMGKVPTTHFVLPKSEGLSRKTNVASVPKVSSVHSDVIKNNQFVELINAYREAGYVDNDINRLINGEISLSDLMLEIANDKDRTRYKKLFEKKTLGNYKYSYKETSKVLDEAKARQGELDKALRETEFTIINPNSSQEEVAIAKKKAQEITAQIKENNELIVSCTNSINTYGEMEYSFSSMAELEGEISKIEAQLKSLIDEYNRQEAANKFKDYFHYLVFRIDNGDKGTYSEVMNTTIAYEYIDINGNKVIAFTKEQNGQLIKPNGVPEDAKPLTYLDVYGNLDAVLAPRSDESEEDYDARIKRQFTSYESPNNDTSGLLAQINKLNHDKAVYTNIHTYASETINYQMMLDTYINRDNFEENCTFNGNFDDFKTLERRLDIDAKVETMDIDTYTGWVLSNVINGKDEVKNDYAAQLSFNIKGFEIMTSHKELAVNFNEKWRHIMTDDEIAVFNYICNTEGYAAGYKFLESIKNDLDMRWVAQKRATDTKFAGENPVLASIESVFIKPVESVGGALYSLYHVLKGLDMARSNIYSRGDTYRNKVSMNLNILNGEGAAFLYNVVMSMADSALTIALTTATGGGNLLWSTTVMGSSVYLSTLNDALDKGLDPGKAVLLAIVSAGIESLMESYSVSHFTGLENKMSAFLENGTLMAKLQAKLGGKVSEGAFKSISKMAAFAYCAFTQGLVEGEEEISTEILDNIVDIIISGDASAFINNANQYKSEHYGCSDEEAYAFAWGEHLKQVGLSGLAGFTSGIGFGSFAGVKGSRSVQTIIDSNYLQLLQLLQNNENLSVTTNINSQISQTSNIESAEAIIARYTQQEDFSQINYNNALMNDKYYSKYIAKYLELAPNAEAQKILADILLKGKYGNNSFNSEINGRKDNADLEAARRLSMASLFLANPQTFLYLAQNGINMFHGTSSLALSSIIEHGLMSGATQEASGMEVLTGESWSRGISNGQRSFISFTDIFDTASFYAGGKGDSFPVIVCTTSDNIKASHPVTVYQTDYSEVGIKGNYSQDKISAILVPSDKVELVKQMVGDKNIQVLSMSGYENRLFYLNESYVAEIESQEQYEKLKEHILNNSEAFNNLNVDNEVNNANNQNTQQQNYSLNMNDVNINFTHEEVSKFIIGNEFNCEGFYEYLRNQGRISKMNFNEFSTAIFSYFAAQGMNFEHGGNITPETIKSLSPERQKILAKNFSEGNASLESLLLNLWKNGIDTIGCEGGEHATPYIAVSLTTENIELIAKILTNPGMEHYDVHFVGDMIVFNTNAEYNGDMFLDMDMAINFAVNNVTNENSSTFTKLTQIIHQLQSKSSNYIQIKLLYNAENNYYMIQSLDNDAVISDFMEIAKKAGLQTDQNGYLYIYDNNVDALMNAIQNTGELQTVDSNAKTNINSDIRLTHQIEGYEAVYSENELKKYTDDKGQVNYTEFFKFLLLNDRFIVNKNGVKKSSLMQTLKDLKEFYLNPNAKIDEMIDILQDLSRRNWEFANQKYFSSHDNLERIIDNTVYFQSIYNVITLLVNNPLYGINKPRFNELVFLAESIKGKIIDSKVVGSFDYNGAKVELIGTNLEFLSKAAIRLKRVIDKLPQVLKNGNVTSLKIYDTNYFSRYIGLRGIKEWFSPRSADCGRQEIRFFKAGISMTTDLGILDTLVHESGHDFDEYYTSSGYFTEEYPIWKEAKKKDVLWVSLYGETNLFEDFAESVRLYFKNKGLFSALHPNRARVLEAMIDSKNPQSITNTRKLEIMEMFKGNGNLSSEMFHKMFDNDSVKTLTYEEKLKVEAILLYDGIDASDDLYDSMWSN